MYPLNMDGKNNSLELSRQVMWYEVRKIQLKTKKKHAAKSKREAKKKVSSIRTNGSKKKNYLITLESSDS